jgi:hypothetical protein
VNLELGETYSTRFTVTKADGTPGTATVTVTLLLPDGTPGSTSVTNPSAGNYDIDLTTTQIGRHELYVSATGGDLGTLVRKMTDIINVDPTSTGALISLADGKEHLNIPVADTDHDQELTGIISVASQFVEYKTQYWHRTSVTETFRRPGQTLLLAYQPVVSVTSVYIDGVLVDPLVYTAREDAGVIERTTYGYNTNTVWTGEEAVATYVVGAGYVPPVIRHAVKAVMAHLWRTQRGSVVLGSPGPDDVWDPRFGFSYPRAVKEMLEDFEPGVAFA